MSEFIPLVVFLGIGLGGMIGVCVALLNHTDDDPENATFWMSYFATGTIDMGEAAIVYPVALPAPEPK